MCQLSHYVVADEQQILVTVNYYLMGSSKNVI